MSSRVVGYGQSPIYSLPPACPRVQMSNTLNNTHVGPIHALDESPTGRRAAARQRCLRYIYSVMHKSSTGKWHSSADRVLPQHLTGFPVEYWIRGRTARLIAVTLPSATPPSPKVPPIRNYAPLSREEPCSPRLAKLCGLFSSLCIGGGLFDSEKFFLFLFFLGEVKRLREFLLGIRRRDSKRMVERLFLAFEYGCRGSASFSKGM